MLFDTIIGFDWDAGNCDKNWQRHGVKMVECEEVFFNRPLIIRQDQVHSAAERRCHLLGKTNGGRGLFIVFTVRNRKIRVISARDMTPREKRHYD